MHKNEISSLFSMGALLCAGMWSTAVLAADDGNAHMEGIIAGSYQAAGESRVHGQDVNGEGTAQLYLFGTLDMGPGTWNLEVRGGTTPRSNGVTQFYGSNGLVGETTDSDGDGRIAVTQLFYALPVGNGQLRAGLLDPGAVLDTSDVANDEYTQFLAEAFINNATIGFPSFVLGAAYQGNVNQHVDYRIFAGSDSGLEEDDHSYSNVFDVGGDRGAYGKGAFTGAEIGWHANGVSLRGGVWYDSGAVHRINSTSSTHPYGFYVQAGLPAGPGRLAARAGIANDKAQEAADFLSLAYQLPVELADHDTTLGMAIARTGGSSRLNDARPVYQAEAYWRINIADGFYISPDIQYITHAGFDDSRDGTFIGGMRAGFVF